MKKTLLLLFVCIPGMILSQTDDAKFCDAFKKIVQDAPTGFQSVIDKNHYRTDTGALKMRYYDCKVIVPGAVKTEISSMLSYDCMINYPTYGTIAEARDQAEKLITQIKNCFPEYYAFPEVVHGDSIMDFGEQFDDGFKEPAIQVIRTYPENPSENKLHIYIPGDEQTRLYKVTNVATDDQFSKDIKKVYRDIKNDFYSVKSTRHEEKGRIISNIWYDIQPLPEGAISFTKSEGSMSLQNAAVCFFVDKGSYDDALAAFNDKVEKVKNMLGNKFIFYTTEIPDDALNIYSTDEKAAIFGMKYQNRSYQNDIPIIAVQMFKEEGEKHSVIISFFKGGM